MKIKKDIKNNFWSIFFVQASFFTSALLLAIICALRLKYLSFSGQIYVPKISLHDFIFSFFLVTLIALFFVFYKKFDKSKELIYKAIFLLLVFWGGMTVLGLFVPVWCALLFMAFFIFLWIEKPTIYIHDILMVFGLAGTSAFFGLSFSPDIVVMLLIALSFYDFVAVYKTRHMVLMAKEMIEKKVIMGIIIPKEKKYFKDNFDNIKPGGNFFILGGGDIALPGLLAVSIVPFGFLKSFFVVIFAVIGLLVSYYIFATHKDNDPIPALPPIALLSIIGYFLTLLF